MSFLPPAFGKMSKRKIIDEGKRKFLIAEECAGLGTGTIMMRSVAQQLCPDATISPKGPGAQAPFTEELEQLTSVIQEQKSSSRCSPSSNRFQDAQLAFPWKSENIAAMGVIHLLHLQV